MCVWVAPKVVDTILIPGISPSSNTNINREAINMPVICDDR